MRVFWKHSLFFLSARLLKSITLVLALTGFSGLFAGGAYGQDWRYTVRPGDTLWSVGERYLRSVAFVPRLQTFNGIADAYRLAPGKRLRIPVSWLRTEPVSAIAQAVSGDAIILPAGGGQQRTLVSGDPLQSGDTVRTQADANVVLQFIDGSEFIVRQNSELVLDQVGAYTETSIANTSMRLQSGRVQGQVQPDRGAATRFQIRTPAAQTAVRGTDYRVSYDTAEDAMRVEVLSGQVDVKGRNVTRRVQANFGAAVQAGQAPTRPRPLLPPPALSTLPDVLDRLPLALDWSDVPQAAGYRVQISSNTDFKTLLVDESTQTSQLRVRDLPDGQYVLRLRGIDALGLEGRDAERALVINARPEPPFLVGPNADSTVRIAVPEMQWTEAENAVGYHLQVAHDADFARIVFDDANYRSDRWQPQAVLPEGEYYWRIATIDGSGEQGPYSDTIRFWLRPTPDPEPPAVGEEQLTFRFAAGLPGETYHFQLARDQTFTDLLEDQILTEPEISLAKPVGGNTYYMRYAMIGPDQVEGPFSSVQRIYLPIDDYQPMVIFSTLIGLLLLL